MCKIGALLRRLVWLRDQRPDEKSLVFSQWGEALQVGAGALCCPSALPRICTNYMLVRYLIIALLGRGAAGGRRCTVLPGARLNGEHWHCAGWPQVARG